MIRWLTNLFRRRPAADPYPSTPIVVLADAPSHLPPWVYRSHVALGHNGRAHCYGATFVRGESRIDRVYEFHTAKPDAKLATYFADLAKTI